MPTRNEAIHAEPDDAQSGSRAPDGLSTQDPGLHQGLAGRSRVPEWLAVQTHRDGFGDLLNGGIAVAALLGMVAIGMTTWLAILLAVITYGAVSMLRPEQGRGGERGSDPSPPPSGSQDGIEDDHSLSFPEPAPANAGTVAASFGLTRREQDVLPLLVQRLTDREIAERLNISHRTAMNHTANILGKLGLTSRREVAPFVLRYEHRPPVTTHGEPE